MKTPTPNNISTIRKQKGLTQQELADRLDSHWVTVSKLERGVMQLTHQWMEKLSTALEVPAVALFSDPEPKIMMVSLGVTGTGAVEPLNEPVYFSSTINHPGEENTYWIYVDTDELLPFATRGDLLRFEHYVPQWAKDREGIASLKGRLCLSEGITDFISIAQFVEQIDEQSILLKTLTGRKFTVAFESLKGFLSGYAPAWDLEVESQIG